MEKLLDIMNSMNEQITKLAEAVTDAVQSSDDEKVCDYRKLYASEDRKEKEDVGVDDGLGLNEGNEEEQESANEEVEEVVHEDEKGDEDLDEEEDTVRKRASDSKAHLMKDLREHLFAKVLSTDKTKE